MTVQRPIALLILLATPSLSHAATLTVDRYGSGAYTTIQSAINAASDGDVITVKAATYTEAIDLKGKKITVKSEKGSSSTIIDANSTTTWAVTMNNGESSATTLQGFTIKNGAYAGLYLKGASATFKDITIKSMGASAGVNGAGAYIEGGSPSFTSSEFTANTSSYGGHIYVTSSATPSFDDVAFTSGYGSYGGAIFVESGSLTLKDSQFDGNLGYYGGGGIYLASGPRSSPKTSS
jgi:hypothetical protein